MLNMRNECPQQLCKKLSDLGCKSSNEDGFFESGIIFSMQEPDYPKFILSDFVLNDDFCKSNWEKLRPKDDSLKPGSRMNIDFCRHQMIDAKDPWEYLADFMD